MTQRRSNDDKRYCRHWTCLSCRGCDSSRVYFASYKCLFCDKHISYVILLIWRSKDFTERMQLRRRGLILYINHFMMIAREIFLLITWECVMLLFYSYNLASDSIEKSELRNSTNHSFPESLRSAVNNPIMTITSTCSSVSQKRHRASICQLATPFFPALKKQTKKQKQTKKHFLLYNISGFQTCFTDSSKCRYVESFDFVTLVEKFIDWFWFYWCFPHFLEVFFSCSKIFLLWSQLWWSVGLGGFAHLLNKFM